MNKKITALKERKIRGYDPGSRVNNLDCLYMLSNIMSQPAMTLDMGLKKTVELIPPYWQYPGITCSRVVFKNKEYKTSNFKKSKWRQSADITVSGEKFGILEIYYLEKKPEAYEGPFLKEERGLINGIAEIISGFIKQKETVEALKQSEENYNSLFARSPFYAYVTDLKGNLLDANSELLKRMGMNLEEIKNTNFKDFLARDNLGEMQNSLKKLVAGKKVKKLTVQARTPGGEIFEYEVNTILITGKDKKPNILNIARDITKAKKAVKEIKSLSKFPSENPNPVLRIDYKGKILYSNQSCKKKLKALGSFKEGQAPHQILDLISDTLKEKSKKHSIIDISFGKKVYKFFITPVKEGGYINIYGMDITVQKKAESKLKESYLRLKKTLNDTINALALIVESRDPYTSGHQKRVARLAIAISEKLGLDPEKTDIIGTAALIHDIGKIAIPASILSKPGKISRIEYDIVKTHSQVGYDMLKNIKFSQPIAKIVLQHHERIDGSGYPKGLIAKNILFEAKILAVADVVEAISSHRPYRPALGIDRALQEVNINRGRLYDPAIVDACNEVFENKDFDLQKI